jgi:ornithine cyclodeaminase/alanine dehydrogenase-like protein (mu-crystallin family)
VLRHHRNLDAGGVIERSDIVAELSQVLGGALPGRTHVDEITLFKSVGAALADVAAALLVVRGGRAAH